MSEERLLRTKRPIRIPIEDTILRNSLLYICGSCMLLIIVFLTLLPGALFNYLRRINFLKGVVAAELQHNLHGTWNQLNTSVFCHLNLSAFQRPDRFRYTVHDVPVNGCSHVVFPLHGLQDWFEDMLNFDAYNGALHPGLYKDMQYLKKENGLKVLVYVNTLDQEQGRKHLVEWVGQTESMALHFARNLNKWLLGNFLDGIIFEGVFPAPEEERTLAIKLLKKMHTLLKQVQLLLCIVVTDETVNRHLAAFGKRLNPHLDYLVIRNHDNHAELPNTAKKRHQQGPEALANTIEAAIAAGMHSHKLLASIELDGTSFRVQNATTLPGLAGPVTQKPGVWAYFEVCALLQNESWTRLPDTEVDGSPVAIMDDERIAFDNPDSVQLKMAAVKNNSLGGVILWDVTSDDYTGVCGEVNPLTRVVWEALTSRESKNFVSPSASENRSEVGQG